MEKPRRPPPRRDDDRKVIAGVCAGAARWLGVDPLIVRIAVVVLTVASGVGLPIYIAGWLLLPPADGSPAIAARLRARPGAWQIGAGVGCLTLGGLLTIRELGLWWSDAIVWPFVLAAAGAAMLWRQTASRRAGPDPTRSPRASTGARRWAPRSLSACAPSTRAASASRSSSAPASSSCKPTARSAARATSCSPSSSSRWASA
jgi:phage shock protein PspC (stress-responsive transcriptional regulator)